MLFDAQINLRITPKKQNFHLISIELQLYKFFQTNRYRTYAISQLNHLGALSWPIYDYLQSSKIVCQRTGLLLATVSAIFAFFCQQPFYNRTTILWSMQVQKCLSTMGDYNESEFLLSVKKSCHFFTRCCVEKNFS